MKKKRKREFNPRVVIVPYDGEPNPENPYDHLDPKARYESLVDLCARIRLRARRNHRIGTS